MRNFHNILFVSQGLSDDSEVMRQALGIARDSKAELSALIVSPEFPDELDMYREKYEAVLIEGVNTAIQAARERTGLGETALPIQIHMESGSTPAERIIRHVLKHAHDLVIKEAERKGGAGFKALDMELLRKCPCPVWLGRPVGRHGSELKVAVAIDPQSNEAVAHDLSLRLLQLSRALADTCSGELNIVSCWDYPLEDYLRNSPWMKMPEEELLGAVVGAQNQHRSALNKLIKKSGIGGKLQIHDVRGRADRIIPRLVTEQHIDILVMGTVARTGIPGFIIGNTAENVVQQLKCSLLALKPNGFVSPVKAY